MSIKNILITILSFLLLAACQKSKNDTEEKPVPVKVYQIKPDNISSYLEITGNLEAGEDAIIFSQVSEELKQILKPVGSKVSAGETIAVLQNNIWQEALKQAKASLESIEARHAQVTSDYDRYQRLYDEKAISQQQWEKIRSAMQETEASLAQVRAAYQQANEQFLKTYIQAPFAGTVGSLYFDQGQMVPMGQPVAKIINTRLMKARLNIPDIHIQKLHIGQNVEAEFPVWPDLKFTGLIRQIDPAIDPFSRTVEAEVVFENKDNKLQSGLYGQFKLELQREENSVIIPENALMRRTQVEIDPETGETSTSKQYFVFVVNGDSARQIEVLPGLESDGRVQITSGLAANDRVIIVGQKIVKNGRMVTIIPD